MAALALFIFVIGTVLGISYGNLDFNLTARIGGDAQIEVIWMNSVGLLCDTGLNGDKIVEVVCGEKGGIATKVTNPTYDQNSQPDYTMSNMTCTGSEETLTDCNWGLNLIQPYDYCTLFVGANCNE